MATIFFASFLLLLLLIWMVRRIQKPTDRRSLPPQADGAWPVIGHLHLLGGEPIQIILGKIADKCGPIFTLRLGVHRTLVVSSPEMAKECLGTNDKAFANRPIGLAAEHMAYDSAVFVFSPYNSYLRQMRKIATHSFLSNHRLETLKNLRESEVNASIKEIHKLWIKNDKVLVEMNRWFGFISLNVILTIVVGKRFPWAATKDEMSEGADQYRKAFRDFFQLIGTATVSDALPYLRWLDVGGHERAMKKTAKRLDDVVDRWLQEHKHRTLISDEAKGPEDFMDVMLSMVRDYEDTSKYDADTVTKATCLAIVLGATDTTAIQLTWAVALLLNNREALKKAQQELDLQVGREREVKESDVKNLVYLQAVVKETMRLYPSAPLLIPHESSEDCTIAGYHVPAGTRLFVNVSKIHRDPNVWSDPNEFRPERFLTTSRRMLTLGANFEYLPFGSGRRVCPGISFALHVMHLTLANLLHAFEITTPFDEPVDMAVGLGPTNLKATPLEVHLNPRLPDEVFASLG
ncbi:Cytochrome P450 82C4 [Morella rubra]|uniref:Cytochrome P450 82C4 n=1 Tax=Morella rubra TaxID=262757 RepID=A0A6A1W8V6_9ROSI|nr:Cytochrome P450 82C4 [Morella rubra]